MAENSDLDEASSVFDSDAITDYKENHPSRLIRDFSSHKYSGNLRLCAYGTSRYALVFNECYLIIYNPDTSTSISYELKATLWWRSAPYTFTSIIAYKDDFFIIRSIIIIIVVV